MPTIYNKVELDGTTLLDLSQDTASSASHIRSGYTAHLNNGTQVTGTYSGGTPSLQSKTHIVTSAGTATVTPDSGYDGLSSVAVTVPSADANGSVTGNFVTVSGVEKFRITGESYAETGGWVDGDSVIGESAVRDYDVVSSGTSVTPTESAQTIGGAYYMMESAVTVNAIPSNYVGSGVTQRSSSDLTASGATVTVPSGYYSEQASKAIASGTQGTPSFNRSAGTNSVTLTPVVVNSAGYINGGTRNGEAVTISASELVSGTLPLTDNGTADCTNYASVNVNIPFVTYYTGSSTPASSLGSNGDIYLKVVS